MKLAIGTAQFGMNYGAFNTSGKIDQASANGILEQAKQANISLLDTARAYGDSELVLGRIQATKSFDLVTKCPSLADESDPATALRLHFQESLERLDTESVYGYLLHRSEDLDGSAGREIWNALCELRDEGSIKNIGVSAYHPEEVRKLLQKYPLSLVQLPINVLSHWLYTTDYLEMFEQAGVELHARSAFLQGFLLSDPNRLDGYLKNWKHVLVSFRERASELGLNQMQACLSPLISQSSIDRVVIGVDSISQLCEILSAANPDTISTDTFRDIATTDQGLIDPRLWKM